MKIKTELLKEHISEYIINNIEDFEIDESKIADTKAIKIVEEIKGILENSSYSDFEAVEEITKVFEKNNICCSYRHDF